MKLSFFVPDLIKLRNCAFLFIIAVLATSCASRKTITYFQPASPGADTVNEVIKEKYTPIIQPGDVLSILVSSLSPDANAMFNIYPETQTQSVLQTGAPSDLVTSLGFLVSTDGSVTLPLTGKIHVAGLTILGATDTIEKKLDKFLVEPNVNVRILNFKISVLGEVAKPAVYNITGERVTLPEAISLAGDLTIYGRRNNILLIREENGKREFARIDLTKRDFFESPYYYLRPNDVIYVEPGRGKVINSGNAVIIVPIIISSLTLLVLALSVVKL